MNNKNVKSYSSNPNTNYTEEGKYNNINTI